MTNDKMLDLIRQADEQIKFNEKKGITDNYTFQVNWKKEHVLDTGYWAAPQVVRFLLALLDEKHIENKRKK